MKQYAIMFGAPMVQALLAGRKTQTRRRAWKEPSEEAVEEAGQVLAGVPHVITGRASRWQHVQPGDRLWVQEDLTKREGVNLETGEVIPGLFMATYRADGVDVKNQWGRKATWWAPRKKHIINRHMPRWASRITLTVTDVRVQRLQEITHADAHAEGMDDGAPIDAIDQFRDLWISLYSPAAWVANPEVVAITFSVAQRNIDA